MSMALESAKQKEENKKLLPTEEMFVGRPGYQRKRAKVWRMGEGWVDGHKWNWSFKPNKGGRLTPEAREASEMIAPYSQAEAKRQSIIQALEPAPEWRPPAVQAEAATARNSWGRRATFGYSRAFSEAPYWRNHGRRNEAGG